MEHVYLTENDVGSGADKYAAFQPLIQQGFLTLTVDETPKAQLHVYQKCIDEHRWQHNWMAFFDVDEFLVIKDKCALFIIYFFLHDCLERSVHRVAHHHGKMCSLYNHTLIMDSNATRLPCMNT